MAADKAIHDDPNRDELFLVDGSGFIFRAFFALPQNLTNPQGVPVGAVLGFTNMLTKLLTDMHAPYIAVIFDAARDNFRNEIFDDYKANRDETPPDLIPQFGLIREATEAFDIPAIEMEGYEADDLIAAYADLAVAQGKSVTIVGSDKDLYQLVRDGVRLFDPIKQKYIGPVEVEEKFGVPPEKVIDVQALAGDSVDNIPGVPGIGVKTAAQLINEYGSLEELLDRAEEIKQPKRRESLIEHRAAAIMSKKLVTLEHRIDVPVALDDMKSRDPGSPKLAEFLQTQGFKSVAARLNQSAVINDNEGSGAVSVPTAQNDMPAIKDNLYTLINDQKTLQQWIARATETGFLAIDTETTSLTPMKADLVGISIACELGKAAYIPLGHVGEEVDLLGGGADIPDQLPVNTVIAAIKPLLEDPSVLKIGHNMKYDWQILAKQGVRMTPCDDTMLLSYVLDGTQHKHGMDSLSALYFAHDPIKYEEVCGKGKSQITFDKVPVDKALDYAAEDAEITLRLHKTLKPRLAQEKMVRVYEEIERPLIPIIAEMEMAGVRVDPAFLKSLSTEFGKKLVTLEQDIFKLAGTEFNVASPKQVGEILFKNMGLQGGKKTKTGDYSTSVDVLEKLAAEGNEIVQKILDHRQLSKLKSTYTDALQEQIVPATGRVHTSFHMTGTSTGRLASSDPNVQNIPIRTEEGRRIREAFIAEDGHVLLAVDYSQVELRLAAEMAGIDALKEAFKNGDDIHAITASKVFGVPLNDVTSEIRRQAKAVNFGIIYGISGFGLAKQLGVDNKTANDFIKRYLAQFHELQDYMERTKEEAREHGYVRTLMGRKCTVFSINDKNPMRRMGAERQAINAPLQGTAADIMKMAMSVMPRKIAEAGLSAKMLLQVHDELIFEVPEAELDKTSELVKNVMESVVTLSVPLDAESGSGPNWAKAH